VRVVLFCRGQRVAPRPDRVVGQGWLRLPDRAVSGGPFMSGLAILRVIVDLLHVTPGRNAQRIARAGVVARSCGGGLTR